MSCWALVPVKARSAGKRRLAQALPEAVRARLIQVMLEQVLATLRACPEIHSVAVMTPDRDRLPPDIAVLPDAGAEMNASLTRALATLQARGARRVAIVFPDLPQLLPGDVAALVQAAPEGAVGLAPDHSGQGTNAVCVSLPTPFDFHFGPGSFALHVAEAQRLGLVPVRVPRPGLAFDIDEPADVKALIGRADARYAFLG